MNDFKLTVPDLYHYKMYSFYYHQNNGEKIDVSPIMCVVITLSPLAQW